MSRFIYSSTPFRYYLKKDLTSQVNYDILLRKNSTFFKEEVMFRRVTRYEIKLDASEKKKLQGLVNIADEVGSCDQLVIFIEDLLSKAMEGDYNDEV